MRHNNILINKTWHNKFRGQYWKYSQVIAIIKKNLNAKFLFLEIIPWMQAAFFFLILCQVEKQGRTMPFWSPVSFWYIGSFKSFKGKDGGQQQFCNIFKPGPKSAVLTVQVSTVSGHTSGCINLAFKTPLSEIGIRLDCQIILSIESVWNLSIRHTCKNKLLIRTIIHVIRWSVGTLTNMVS